MTWEIANLSSYGGLVGSLQILDFSLVQTESNVIENIILIMAKMAFSTSCVL